MFSRISEEAMAYVPLEEIDDLEGVQERLTAKSRYQEDHVSVPMFHVRGNEFGYPRYWKPQAARIVDRRSPGAPVTFRVTKRLLPAQRKAFDQFLDYYDAGKTGFGIQANCGWGKTIFMLCCMARISRAALVVVPTNPLIDRWKEAILDSTTLTEEDIGFVSGRKAQWFGKAVVVGLVNSLALDYLPKEFKSYFGQIWYDELHTTVPPPTFEPVMKMFPAVYRGGASATPYRADGLHSILRAHVSEVWIRGDDANRMIPTVYVYRMKQDLGWIPDIPEHQLRGILITRLASNQKRNRIVAHYADWLYTTGRKTLVISDRTSQLWKLREILMDLYSIPSEEIGFFCAKVETGKQTIPISKQQREAARECPLILATYRLMKLGENIPDLSGLVFGTPQSNPTQTWGRIARFTEDKLPPIIIDLWDTFYELTEEWCNRREKHYRREKLPVKELRRRKAS